MAYFQLTYESFNWWWKELETDFPTDPSILNIIDKIRDQQKNNFLHYVARTDYENLAKKLIELGCDVNCKNTMGLTPIVDACTHNKLKMVKIFLSAGADCKNFRYHRVESTLLHLAVSSGSTDIVAELLKAGVDINAVNMKGKTPLHIVAFNKSNDNEKNRKRSEVIKVLIKAGANVDARDQNGTTPLYLAAQSGFREAVKILIDAGADVNIKDINGCNILSVAVSRNKMRITKRLIKAGADINARIPQTANGNILHFAATNATVSIEMLKLLLENGASINVFNDIDYDPICFSLRMRIARHFDNFDYKIENLDDFARRNYPKLIPDTLERIQLLIDYGANVNRVNRSGISAISIVLKHHVNSFSRTLQLLLANGATLDYANPKVQKIFKRTYPSKFPKVLVRHAALLEASNNIEEPKNFDAKKLNENLQDYYNSCREELNKMKNTKIGDTDVTFFEILVSKNTGPYARNEEVSEAFKENYEKQDFPIYKELFVEKFLNEIEKQRRLKEATEGLCYILKWNENSMHVVLSTIISYCNDKDLSTLIAI